MSGLKHDEGKLDWYALPLEILEPLVDLFNFGVEKYGLFNCLEHFENSNSRFWSANMRHAAKCQQDPLAIDEETGCYHEAARAFCSLMRIYHAKKDRGLLSKKIGWEDVLNETNIIFQDMLKKHKDSPKGSGDTIKIRKPEISFHDMGIDGVVEDRLKAGL